MKQRIDEFSVRWLFFFFVFPQKTLVIFPSSTSLHEFSASDRLVSSTHFFTGTDTSDLQETEVRSVMYLRFGGLSRCSGTTKKKKSVIN